ncbi:MAG: 3-hydroxybutyryl-CoA dehydrogenase [Burkholderiaceae bacterium]
MAGAASSGQAGASPGADDAPVVAAGSGRMGRSMAVAFAIAGRAAVMLDLKARDDAGVLAQGTAARAEVDGHLATLVRIGLLDAGVVDTVRGRISFVAREAADSVLGSAPIVLEGVPERLDAKREAFAFIEARAPADAVIASTTSSFLSTDLAGMLERPARFLNAHWLNPAYLIPIVEVSPHEGTAPGARARLVAALEAIGKVPVMCAPRPGYIVPRLQALVMNEAARMVDEGVASAEEIDRAVRLGFGMRYASMGLLEFVDFGGVDILYYASRYMAEKVDAARYAVPDNVAALMAAGNVGLRSGKGFYDWTKIDADAYRADVMGRFLALLRHQGALPRLADSAPAGPDGDARC